MKSRHVDNIEELILDGVDRLLARGGYDEVSIDSLARELGLRRETLYVQFPTKRDLMLSHVDRIVREVVRRLRDVAEGTGPPAEKIRRMLILRVMLRFDSVQHYSESLSEVLRDLRLSLLERREHYFEAEAKIFAVVLDQGQKSGAFRIADRIATANSLVEATNAVLPFNLTEQELNHRPKFQKRVEQIADLLVSALIEPGRSSARVNGRA
jgi:AcrR family transcriptional regulator